MQKVMKEAENKMKKAVEHLIHEFSTVRTGRANVHLLDGIKVDYYGSATPLNQLATVSAPEASLLTISPFDPSSLGNIEKAIQASDLGLNPANDGKLIRLPIPPLTEERRMELTKLVAKMAEEAKTSVRNVRRTANDEIKDLEKDKELSEDQMHDALNEIQELTDKYIEKVDEITEAKKEEIMKV